MEIAERPELGLESIEGLKRRFSKGKNRMGGRIEQIIRMPFRHVSTKI